MQSCLKLLKHVSYFYFLNPKASLAASSSFSPLLTIKTRSCMILQFSMRPPLTGHKQQRNGKHVWMKHCGRQMSAGYSVRWLSNGCPRTGEWTLLTAHMRRLQVKKQNKPPQTEDWLLCFKSDRKRTWSTTWSFSFLSRSFPLPALVPTVLCDSDSHKTRKDFSSGGLPALTAGASAYCTV